MGRVLVDQLTRVIGWLRRGHRAEVPAHGPTKVNLGSSLLVALGGVNVRGAITALIATWLHPSRRSAP